MSTARCRALTRSCATLTQASLLGFCFYYHVRAFTICLQIGDMIGRDLQG